MSKVYSDRDLLDALFYARSIGYRTQSQYEMAARLRHWPSMSIIKQRFGSFGEALALIGQEKDFNQGRPKGRVNEETSRSRPQRAKCSAHFWSHENPETHEVYHQGYIIQDALNSRRKHGGVGDIVRVDYDCATA